MTTLFSDDFNRANGALGGNWSGSGAIISNAARHTGFGAEYSINTSSLGTADYEVSSVITQGSLTSGGARGMGLVARYQDSSNFYLAWLDSGGAIVTLYRVSGGGYTALDDYNFGAANGDPVTLLLGCDGDTIYVKVNGTQRISETDNTHTTEGDFGFRTYDAGTFTDQRYDDFLVADLAPAGPTYTRSLAGSLPAPTGSLTRVGAFKRSLAGSLPSPTGELNQLIAGVRSLAGSLPSPTGVLERLNLSTRTRSLAGSLPSPTAVLTRLIGNRGRTLAGSLPSPTGALSSTNLGVLSDTRPAQCFLMNENTEAAARTWGGADGQPFSMAFWCRLDADSYNHGNVTTITNAAFNSEVGFWIPSFRPGIFQGSVMYQSQQTDVLLPEVDYGDWHHVALTRDDPSGNFRCYLDGVVYPDETGTTPDPQNAITDVAYFVLGAGGPTHFFRGAVSQLRVWTDTLSTAEVQAEMASYSAVRTSGLYGDWKLDGTLEDDSGNGNDLSGGLGWPNAASITYDDFPIQERALAGSLPSPTGVLTRVGAYVRGLTGSLPSPTGALTPLHTRARSVAGSLPSPTGVLTRKGAFLRSVSGVLPAPTGTLVRLIGNRARALAGSLPAPTGALSHLVTRVRGVSGSLPAPTGSLTSITHTARGLAGSLPSPTGQLTYVRTFLRTVEGNLPALTGELSYVPPAPHPIVHAALLVGTSAPYGGAPALRVRVVTDPDPDAAPPVGASRRAS